jgi:hypothetical protein
MFELEKSSLFFEGMGEKHPEIVQNIEIVHENKMALDESYHIPKHFILNLNNSLRSLLFFIESSVKNSPSWLHTFVKDYRSQNKRDYEILKRLRDVSAHQALIFPAESIMIGLYRIRSSDEYVAKIGMGDLKGPGSYSWDLAMNNTDEVFHDLLVFHSMTFMDLEHSALNECLGITRKWFFHVKFSNKENSYDEVVDVYEMLCDFSAKLLDSVCLAYAKEVGIEFDMKFHHQMKEFNCVNTLLEIDLYPSLFSKWWECEISPLNYGVRVKMHNGKSISALDEIHSDCYKHLCDSPESYKDNVIKYIELPIEEFLSKENINEFHSFIYFNHWHFKNSFTGGLMEYPISPPEIMRLQRLGKIFVGEFKKEKLCTISSTGIKLKDHLSVLLSKI